MHVERGEGRAAEVLLPCLPVFWRQTFSLFGILSLARSQLAYARRVLFLAIDHTCTQARARVGIPWHSLPPSSSPPDTDRQTCYRINFIPTRYHRRPRPPIPYSHLSSLSLPPFHSIFPSIRAVSSYSIRPKQSKFQPQQCGRRRAEAERSNSSYSWQRRRRRRRQ